ncbi:MAG TPA: prepilin peptidase [Myxococcaceae bacterium]|nr:prepilin peptidase [Myxococcaceae bacterium]
MISTTALLALLFVLGLMVGSFLNVVIARVPQDLSIVLPGSRCPRCGHELPWYENVPLLSWVALRARCRSCRAPISARYPAVELLTGLLFVAAGWAVGWSWQLPRVLLLAGFLVPLALIDLEHWIVPIGITVVGTAAGLLSAVPLGLPVIEAAVIGAAAGFLVFWALERVSLLLVVKVLRPPLRRLGAAIARARGAPPPEPEPDPTEALGAGDKWIMLLVGSYLGWRPLFGVLLLSALQGAVVGSVLLAVQGRAGSAPPPPGAPATEDGWQPEATALPYGPWLALAALEIALLGPWLAESFPSPLVALITGQPWVPLR